MSVVIAPMGCLAIIGLLCMRHAWVAVGEPARCCGLAVADVTLRGVTAGGLSASGAAAVVVLAAEPLGGTELGRRVGLTQSAAARMVDSLVTGGLVTRSSREGRAVLVSLTDAGRELARSLLAARESALAGAVGELSAGEREQLTGLLEKLLGRLYADIGSADLMCRLCDRPSCVDGAVCPVGQAERDAG